MSAIAKRLVDGADAALSSLANRHEDLPVHGRIDADTVPETTKLGRPSHLSSGYGRCRKGAPIRALPALSSPVSVDDWQAALRRCIGGGTIRHRVVLTVWRLFASQLKARRPAPRNRGPLPARGASF
jgi:hypothetical protein